MPETLDTDQLTKLFQLYSPSDLSGSERNKAAFANDVYNITDSDGQKYVMRILKNQPAENVALEAQMQRRLTEAELGTPTYIEIAPGNYVGEREGTRFTLSKFIEGRAPQAATLNLIQDLGATFAKLHDALEGIIIPPSDMQWFNPANAQKDLAKYDGPLKGSLALLISSGLTIFGLNLPRAVTHGDLWLGNVFAKDDKVAAVFDLETAEDTIRIIDLARAYASLRFNTDFTAYDISGRLFTGYDSAARNLLSQAERSNFNPTIAYVAGVCATWNALHGTRYADPYITVGKEALSFMERDKLQ